MADVLTPFCASLLCFGGQNPSLVLNQRQLVEAIFAGICVCTSVWEAATSLHRDSPLEWAQFLAKTETNSWHRVEQLFFFSFFRSHARVSGSQWVVCWAFTHYCAHFPMSAYRLLFVFDLFEWDGFFKNRIKARLIIEDVPICKISQGLLLLRSDEHFSKSWQLKTCSYEALAVFSLKFVILNHFQEQMQRTHTVK